MRTSLKIVADKPSPAGRIYPKAIVDKIVEQLNSSRSPIFLVNRVGLTEDVDQSRTVGFVTKDSARIEENGELTIDITWFKKQIALAQPFDAQKYPQVGTQGGGVGNAVEQLFDAGGLKVALCGAGEISENKVVTEYKVAYIYTEPLP